MLILSNFLEAKHGILSNSLEAIHWSNNLHILRARIIRLVDIIRLVEISAYFLIPFWHFFSLLKILTFLFPSGFENKTCEVYPSNVNNEEKTKVSNSS